MRGVSRISIHRLLILWLGIGAIYIVTINIKPTSFFDICEEGVGKSVTVSLTLYLIMPHSQEARQLALLKINISPKQEHKAVKSQFVLTTCVVVLLLFVSSTVII